MAAKKKIPKFNSEDEELEFWDTHDFNDYIDFDAVEYVDFSYLRSASSASDPFADLVLILTDARPGWVLLDLKPVQLSLPAWRTLRILAEAPSTRISSASLMSKETGTPNNESSDFDAQIALIQERFAEAVPGREQLIVRPDARHVMLDLQDRNVVVAKEAVASESTTNE